jgi:hypothetical protein
MNRFEYIQLTNPEWANKVSNFVADYPEFLPYVYLIPVTPNYRIHYKNVNTIFQAVLFYICKAGVRMDYAMKQWDIIYPLINKDSWEEILVNMELLKQHTSIQPKKREVYYNICIFMNNSNITHKTINSSHISLIKKNVKGVGEGCIAYIKTYFTDDDDCIETTHINFKKGFVKIYGNDSMNLINQKKKEWISKNYGRIANLFVFQMNYII